MLERVKLLLSRCSLVLFGKAFDIIIKYDQVHNFDLDTIEPRVYIQIGYWDKCCKTSNEIYWYSRKWYLSEHMVDDEIIKTLYLCFEVAVKHELLEAFKVDKQSLFNPHLDFEELLKVKKERIR